MAPTWAGPGLLMFPLSQKAFFKAAGHLFVHFYSKKSPKTTLKNSQDFALFKLQAGTDYKISSLVGHCGD